jgi:hypothetical protein
VRGAVVQVDRPETDPADRGAGLVVQPLNREGDRLAVLLADPPVVLGEVGGERTRPVRLDLGQRDVLRVQFRWEQGGDVLASILAQPHQATLQHRAIQARNDQARPGD